MMTTAGSPRRGTATILLVALAALLLTALGSAPAAAVPTDGGEQGAPGPGVSASLSDLAVRDGRLEALLTVTAAGDSARVDASSIQVSLGGRAARHAEVAPIQQKRRAVMMLIDTSGSMMADGIAASEAAARTFLRQVPSDVAVGLTTFADKPHVLVRPTTERRAVLKKLPSLEAKGETALYDGVRAAVAAMGKRGSRTVLLLSDGGDTVSRASLAETRKLLRARQVRLEAVSFRTKESDNGALGELAATGRGHVARAADSNALTKAFGSVASALAGQVRLTVPVPDGVTGKQAVRVSGTANGRSFSAGSAVELPTVAPPAGSTTTAPSSSAPPPSRDAAPAPAPAEVGGPFSSEQWAWGAGILVFLGLLGLGLAVAAPVFMPASKRRMRSMDKYVRTSAPARAKAATAGGGSAAAAGALRLADSFAKRRPSSARTALLLERADLPLRLNEWYVLRFVAVVVSFAFFWLLWHGSSWAYLAARVLSVVVGLVLPAVFLRVRAAMRARKFEAKLPDVLTLVASSLSTGFSLLQAVDGIARDAAEPAAKEFSRALAETRIGSEMEDSLDRLAWRMDSTNLRWTVMAIRIQRQVGGNLAETLRTTAATLRDREALKRQVKALSAEGKLSAYILIALPFALFGYMLIANPDYISLLWTTLIGLGMLGFAAVSLTIGILWMRKTVVVEV